MHHTVMYLSFDDLLREKTTKEEVHHMMNKIKRIKKRECCGEARRRATRVHGTAIERECEPFQLIASPPKSQESPVIPAKAPRS